MSGNMDVELVKLLNGERGPVLDNVQLLLTASAAVVAFGLPVLFALIGLLRRKTWLLWAAAYAAATVISSAIVVNILKPLVDRPRPFEVLDSIVKLTSGGGGSFPSGHTGDAFSIAVAMCLLFRRYTIVVPALLWAIGVGWSRVALGVHYPSDVLGGIVIGTLSAALWSLFFKKRLQTVY
ncbi:MAG: phosphatase PAP2 family protein [Flavobacteriales bacterium]